MQSEPRIARNSVWALPISLAATFGITVVFSSSGYLDVSVHRVPHVYLCIQYTLMQVSCTGFPHSDICGSLLICSSPQLFAAYHVFHRLLVPRHPPCALISFTISGSLECTYIALYVSPRVFCVYREVFTDFSKESSILYCYLQLFQVALGCLIINYKIFISVFGFQGTLRFFSKRLCK